MKYILLILSILLQQLWSSTIDTFIPGYNLDITGLSNQISNSYYDVDYQQDKDCPTNCGSCINLQTCTSCKYGYFLWSPPYNNDIYCAKCPLFDINTLSSEILCADCVTQPLIWYQTKRCTYKYVRIDELQATAVVRYKKVIDSSTQSLFQVYGLDYVGLNIQVEEFKGGDSWCGNYISLPQMPAGCSQYAVINPVDSTQFAVICRSGYVFNSINNSCDKCPNNCNTCSSSTECIICQSGYALGIKYQCVSCSQIPNCQSCFYGDSSVNLQSTQLLIANYADEAALNSAGYYLRCTQCSQKPTFLIPTYDLKECISCSSLSQCLGCRLAKISVGQVIDHSSSPYVVEEGDKADYKLYCLSCQDPYFVKYDGTCEQCVDTNCELCYYGTQSGSDISYTLQQNFAYTPVQYTLAQEALYLKCAFCIYANNQSALLMDGTCLINQSYLSTKDGNCAKWRQWKTKAASDSWDGTYFECTECSNGYGFDAGKAVKDRVCDQNSYIMNVAQCSSYYYITINGNPQGVTCTRCYAGYVASPSRGCISCTSGLTADYNSNTMNASAQCKGCSLITPTGFNFTHYMVSGQIALTKEKAIQAEKIYNLPAIPFCNYCQTTKVYNTCASSCFYNCYNDVANNYYGCKQDPVTSDLYCESCGNQQSVSWTLNNGVKEDNTGCIQCPRYCQFCRERAAAELTAMNPYFNPTFYDQQKYANECIKCRGLSEVCSDYQNSMSPYQGYHLDCPNQTNYLMFYDSSIKQCTPCPQSQQSCKRTLKIQQIIDCRSNISNADLEIGTNQNNYYKQKAGGSADLSHVFSEIGVIFLDTWNPTSSLEVNFKDFDEINYSNLNVYLALNEENISNIEFEILFIPQVKDYQTNNGDSKGSAKVCEFPNDVNFSNQLAKHIANINKISLTFKTINPISGLVGQDSLDFFITTFNFYGWNYFSFQKINFVPMYSIKPTVQLKNMYLKFSDNLFQSKLDLKDIKFTSGYDTTKQQTLLKNANSIFCPVIDTTNIYYMQIQNLKVNNFVYQKQVSLFKFDPSQAKQILTFTIKIINLTIENCQFDTVDIINLFYDTQTFYLKQAFINNSIFKNTNFIKQLPGHDYSQSQQQVQLLTVNFQSTKFLDSKVLVAYNLLKFDISILNIFSKDDVTFTSEDALFTSNIASITKMGVYGDSANNPIKFIKARIFSFPISSPSKTRPILNVDTIKIQQIDFNNINGGIMSLSSYTNKYNVKGELKFKDVTISYCYGDKISNFLINLSQISQVSLEWVNILNLSGIGFFQAENSEQIYVQSGSLKHDQVPGWFVFDNNLSENVKSSNQQGTAFSIKNLRTRFHMRAFNFQYQYIIDRALVQFTHEVRDENYPVEYLTDGFIDNIQSQANAYDFYDQSVTTVVFELCTFDNMGVYVVNSGQISALLLFKTNVKYRYFLLNSQATNLKSYTEQTQLFKESATFIVQDSKDSSLILKGFTLDTSNSHLLMQNGIIASCSVFAVVGSTFSQANFDKYASAFSYKGGFLNIQGSTIIIDTTNFSKSAADQGGAVYIKAYSTQAKVDITFSKFTDIKTSFSVDGIGVGGALSIDGTTSIDLKIQNCEFTNIFAYKKGGVLDLTCGIIKCETNFKKNKFKNIFATSGSLFNIKLNKSIQNIFFSENNYDSDLTIADMLTPYNSYLDLSQDIEQLLQQFYIIVVEGGVAQFTSNVFTSTKFLQGLIYMTGGKVSFDTNTIFNSDFIFTPLVYYNKQTITSFTSLTVLKMNECSDCQQNTSLLFLYSNQLTSFNNFVLVQNPIASFTIFDSTFEEVICTKCTQGILGVEKTTKSGTFNKITFKKNQSNKGSLYLGGTAPAVATRMLQTGLDLSLTGLIFLGNSAKQGGAIYASYYNLQITDTQIKSNSATEGGGIYYLTQEKSPNTIVLISSQIMSNTADVGGGLKIVGTFAQSKSNTVISQNTANISGGDTTTYPIGLKVFLNGIEVPFDSQSTSIVFKTWVSGVTDNQSLIFYLIGYDGKIQKLDTGQTATLTIDLNYASSAPTDAKVTGTTTVNYDPILGGFKLDKIIFQQLPLSQLQAKATSSIIKIPKFDNTGSLLSIDTNYKLPLLMTMRKCVVGEAYISQSGICFKCAKTTYSLVEEATSCLDCPKIGVTECPGGNSLNLSQGYWRPNPSSDLIESCFSQETNCNGGIGTGDEICSEGHIGALCEICDINARFWPESYSNSGEFSCGKCKEIAGNTVKMIGLSIYTLIAILFSVKSTKALLDSYIITFYFQKLGFIQKSAVQSKESVGIIIKLFTTYVQLILVITTFKLKLPPGLNDLTVNVGDPVKQMSFSMDCGLHSMAGSIPMTYFRLMWSQLMPLLYVLTYLIGHQIYVLIKRFKSRAVIAWISFIYIYISMQPSIVRSNIQAVSCRQVSGELYIKSNVSEKCYTAEHIKYSLLLIFPTLMVWVVIIPMYFLRQMYAGRENLSKINMQYKFGFLYSEYKSQSYFWEIVKIYQKTLITIFINIYDSYNDVKGILVIFVLLIYIKLQMKYQPYLEKRFNDLDFSSNLTVVASIIIAIFILDNPFSYLIWFGYIILVFINIYFILRLLRILISGYTQKFEAKIGVYLIKFAKKYPKAAKYLNIPLIPKERTKILWKSLKDYVKANYNTMKVEDIDNDCQSYTKQSLNKNKQQEYIENKQDIIGLKQNQDFQQIMIRNKKLIIDQEQTQFDSPSLISHGKREGLIKDQRFAQNYENSPQNTQQPVIQSQQLKDDFNLIGNSSNELTKSNKGDNQDCEIQVINIE